MKRLIALILTIVIMSIILFKMDYQEFFQYVRNMDFFYLGLALFLFIPQLFISAWRWKLMVLHRTQISLAESLKLVLASSSLNLFLPSKMGDLSKAYFLKKSGAVGLRRGSNIVFFERYIDLAALCLIIIVGVVGANYWNPIGYAGLFIAAGVLSIFPFLYFFKGFFKKHIEQEREGSIQEKIRSFFEDSVKYFRELRSRPHELVTFSSLSMGLWFLHIIQFFFIFRALETDVTVFEVFTLIPLGIIIGLLPITIAGIGTRDAAFLYLFAPYVASPKIVFIGLFATFRYLVPGVMGLPYFNRYMVRDEVKS